MDPLQIVMLQQSGSAFRNGAVEECQADMNIGVHMDNLRKNIAHGYGDIQFLAAFPDESLLKGFSGFCLAADEFPEESPGLMGGTLTDHKAVALPDQRSHNIFHRHFTRIAALIRSAIIFLSKVSMVSIPALREFTTRFHFPSGKFS